MYCPVLDTSPDVITTAHGGGGGMQTALIKDVFETAFGATLQSEVDGAHITLPPYTSAHVLAIQSYFYRTELSSEQFGNQSVAHIVSLVSEEAGLPQHIAVSMIIEEGFTINDLQQIATGMRTAADMYHTTIVTGDTKVVARGCCQGIIITLTCLGTHDTVWPKMQGTPLVPLIVGDDCTYAHTLDQLFGTDVAPETAATIACTPDHTAYCFTTDGHVITPLFFPGGNIGTLAVTGTVNDLLVMGAIPHSLSVAVIIERGFATNDFLHIMYSLQQEAAEAKVPIINISVHLVDTGKCDGIYLITTGVGTRLTQHTLHPTNIAVGDKIILNGDLGRHGIAIMMAREGIPVPDELQSDVQSLTKQIKAILDHERHIRVMRDLTRGGLASALNELADVASVHMVIEEQLVSISEPVHSMCELLGFDAKKVANEGRFVAIVAPEHVDDTLKLLHQAGAMEATVIGEIVACTDSKSAIGKVVLRLGTGVTQILDVAAGEQLPRIC